MQEAIIENINNYQTSSAEDIEVKLKRLSSLLQQGLISSKRNLRKREQNYWKSCNKFVNH